MTSGTDTSPDPKKPAPSPSQLLANVRKGDSSAASELLPLVYDELRALASKYLRHERPDHTLQTTALVHEAYLRLIDQKIAGCEDRSHFFALAATAIRWVLIDHARRHRALKRGMGRLRVTLEGRVASGKSPSVDLLDLDEALSKLAALDERQSRLVELRFFGGLTLDEIARVLGVSPRTVDGDWQMARAWLRRELLKGESL